MKLCYNLTMPEGPEIRRMAETLQPAFSMRLTAITILSGRYARQPFEGIEKPVGEMIVGIRRRGKLLVMDTMNHSLLMTCGMAGHWYAGDPDVRFKRLQLQVEDTVFTYADQRNFGTFKVVSHKDANTKLDEMGVDVFDLNGYEKFRERLARFGKDAPICETLLDQRVAAGVGNYIRADAMYLADIDPRKISVTLNETEVWRLWNTIRLVCDEAYEFQNKYVDRVYRKAAAPCGRPVKSFTDDTGRTVWHV